MSQGVARRLCRPTALQPIGREVHAIGAQLQERFVRKHPERPRYPKAATVAAGTTAIRHQRILLDPHRVLELEHLHRRVRQVLGRVGDRLDTILVRSEEHTSELQSLMRISYAVFCLKKKK